MTKVFGQVYATVYDSLYRDKDYDGECDLLEKIFLSYSVGPVKRILDLGCGTGSHAIPLANRGFEVVGVDHSKDMLVQAREKVAGSQGGGFVDFMEGDIRAVDLRRRFDAAIMMFAVLGYQLNNGDVLSTLKTARRHLDENGLLIFDVWYGPAVLHQGVSPRIKEILTSHGKVVRFTSTELDTRRQVCTVHFQVWRLLENHLVSESAEDHVMRYFFPQELAFFLEMSGFEPVFLGAFPEFDDKPQKTTWNVLQVARAI
jgi:SAM-dependent methyltransferase